MLNDLKILDFSSVLAGPAVATFFAELGAEVIKVENKTAGGDVTRHWKLENENPDSIVSAYFSSVNYGKKYRQLDVFDAADFKELENLIADCDVFITNYKSSSLEKMKLDYKSVSKKFPKIIYGQITGFESEPTRAAYDVVIQAETSVLRSVKSTAFEETKSNSRPGVATNTFTCCIPIICGFIDTPPCTANDLNRKGSPCEKERNTSSTCMANSRVGTNTSTLICLFLVMVLPFKPCVIGSA